MHILKTSVVNVDLVNELKQYGFHKRDLNVGEQNHLTGTYLYAQRNIISHLL